MALVVPSFRICESGLDKPVSRGSIFDKTSRIALSQIETCALTMEFPPRRYRVIATIGKKITELTPTRGFAAEFAAATVVVLASRLGLPVSATHTLVGAVMGVSPKNSFV